MLPLYGMNGFIQHRVLENTFLLTANRTVFWEDEKALIISDLHLGKSGHFRKSGIAIPQNMFREDMQRFLSEIQFFQPAKVIIVGDLFHSNINKEMDLFLKWRNDISSISIHLVKGNHDILKREWYQKAGMEVHEDSLKLKKFVFTHDITGCDESELYCFSGHIHPCVHISGLGKQSLSLACFYFGKKYAVLPAFGKFTGTHPIKPHRGDHIFALVENKIMQIQ
ncbi:MAG TPA: ligase-associated DNA damage response endonuclease PdeM [Ferruginibacter sp.]|nr:ligase-associated DNA damage response endonuclease PdeM [Ferruginibacter sp.]